MGRWLDTVALLYGKRGPDGFANFRLLVVVIVPGRGVGRLNNLAHCQEFFESYLHIISHRMYVFSIPSTAFTKPRK